MNNFLAKLGFGASQNVNKNNKTVNANKKPTVKPQYEAKYGEYNYKTDSTHDLSGVKSFDNTLKMASAGKAPTNVDFSNYNGFDAKIDNPDFDMPTISFYA